MEDLAATDSPATCVAVPWALGDFTAEFGMGSGVGPPLEPPGRPAHPVVACWIGVRVVLVVCVGVVCAGRVGGPRALSLCGGAWLTAVRGGWMIEPVGRLGPVSCVRYRTSTSGLSTCLSCTALRETWF